MVTVQKFNGWTPVINLTRFSSWYDALGELLRGCEELGVDAGVNIRDCEGDTALHMAMFRGNIRAVKLLLKKGGDMMSIGHEGTTVLMKTFLSERVFMNSQTTDAEWDANTSACLAAVLDAVMPRGAGADAGVVAEVKEPAAKRRKIERE
jgi:hypothetical protein